MAKDLALGLVIGGAVNASVGRAFKDVEGRVKRLDGVAAKAKVLQSVIAETQKLQQEWRKAHTTGSAMADGLRKKLDAELDALRRQGVEVRNLGRAYDQMGKQARAADLRAKGHAQMREGGAALKSTAVKSAAAAAMLVVPTKVSADYGAIIRDISIKAGIANQPQEAQMSKDIIKTSRDSGMARNEVAEVVNALVGAGMDLKQAMDYAPVAAKFVVGQGAEGTDTAKMINALGQNAKITNPQDMQKALEAIAFQGQAGSFEAADMAKWFPELLAGMGKLGIYGNDAVTQLGSMLQVQMKTAGSSDEAANNLKNWMEKIGSGDVVKAYKDAGIDYQKSLNTGLQKGMSTLEASFALAQKYVETTDPKKGKAMAEAMAKISKETDPAKAKEMMASLEQALRTGDLFSDMQVKAALTAYSQNKSLYEQLKKDSKDASGILDKNLSERREASAQMWSEAAQAMNDAMRSAGDALRPITDSVAKGVRDVAQGLGVLSDKFPGMAQGVLATGAAISAAATAWGAFKVARGVFNVGRGTLMGNPNLVQKVEVVNASGLGGGGLDLGGGGDAGGKGGKGRKRRWPWSRKEVAPSGVAESSAKPRMRVYAGSGGPQTPGSLSSWRPPTTVPTAASSVVPTGSARPGVSFASGSTFRHIKAEGKGGLPGALFDAAMASKEVYDTAQTQDEKAEGYGKAAGTMAGTLAGAAAGAAIGSVVPVIGTAVGGVIGATLGSMGGGYAGGVAGLKLFGEKPPTSAEPITPMLLQPRPGPQVPTLAQFGAMYAPGDVTRNGQGLASATESLQRAAGPAPLSLLADAAKAPPAAVEPRKVEQTITLSPAFNFTIQGDVRDPRRIVAELMPEIELRLRDVAQQAGRSSMYDEPAL